MMRKTSLLTIAAMVAMSPFALAAGVTVTMNQIDEKGVGKALGTIEFDDGKEGLVIKTKLTGLPPGEHGLHVHEGGDCGPKEKDGKMTAGMAAGGHLDPAKSRQARRTEGPGAPRRPAAPRRGQEWRRRGEAVGPASQGGGPRGTRGGDPRRRRQLIRSAEAARWRWRPHRLRRRQIEILRRDVPRAGLYPVADREPDDRRFEAVAAGKGWAGEGASSTGFLPISGLYLRLAEPVRRAAQPSALIRSPAQSSASDEAAR